MVGYTIKVVYHNVGKGSDNAHIFLEWGWIKKIDIIFIGEPWRSGDTKQFGDENGTKLHNAYTLGAGDHFKDLVVDYW